MTAGWVQDWVAKFWEAATMEGKILVFRKSEALSNGAYQQVVHPSSGQVTAKIMCPRCSLPLSLAGHTITEGGRVHEGVACPCGWRAHIKLDGWGA